MLSVIKVLAMALAMRAACAALVLTTFTLTSRELRTGSTLTEPMNPATTDSRLK